MDLFSYSGDITASFFFPCDIKIVYFSHMVFCQNIFQHRNSHVVTFYLLFYEKFINLNQTFNIPQFFFLIFRKLQKKVFQLNIHGKFKIFHLNYCAIALYVNKEADIFEPLFLQTLQECIKTKAHRIKN